MNTTQPTSDLIISLGHGVLGLALPVEGGWAKDYPVPGYFRPADVASTLDQALAEHPELFGIKDQVDLLVLESPHVILPAYDRDPGEQQRLTRKYIRVRHGEAVRTESVEEGHAFGYALPGSTLTVLRQYFAHTRPVHLATVLWQALSSRHMMQSGQVSRTMWMVPVGNQLAILGAESGRLLYSRVFRAPSEQDRAYFVLSCHHLLRPFSAHWTLLDGLPVASVPPGLSALELETISLPGLAALIEEYRQCGS